MYHINIQLGWRYMICFWNKWVNKISPTLKHGLWNNPNKMYLNSLISSVRNINQVLNPSLFHGVRLSFSHISQKVNWNHKFPSYKLFLFEFKHIHEILWYKLLFIKIDLAIPCTFTIVNVCSFIKVYYNALIFVNVIFNVG